MAESERFYKTLCSLETVRSEKKGFFRDFSEDVARVAGEQWISKVFGRLTTDEERVRTIFTDGKIKDAVLETLNRTEILYRDKDAMASRARRLEGFEALAAEEKRKTLLLFSQAILRAPLPGKCKTVDRGLGLPLAFLARAEAFLTWNEYRFALEDLTFVEEMNHFLPNELRTMLARKKETCEKFLRTTEKNLVSIEQMSDRRNGALVATEEKYVLKGGENPRLPGASILLDVEETVNAGKRVIAAKNIEPGDRLIIESPHAAILLPEFFGTHCQHCFSRFKAPIGCPDCSSVAFCGRKCRDAALASYHKYECKILVLLIGILHGLQRTILSPDPHSERRSSVASSGSGMSVLSMLALRMATQVGPAGCLRIYRALNRQDSVIDGEEIAESSTITTTTEKLSKSAKRRSRRKKLRDSRRTKGEETVAERREIKGEEGEDEEKMVENMDLRVYDLVMHEKRRTAKDFFERSLMAAFLFKCLQKVGFFDNPSSNEEMPNDREIAVASLLLKHLQLLQFNAHEVFETRLGTEHRFRGSKPIYIGVAIYPTVARFNHDCYPAVTRYFLGRCIVIRATRSLQPGDVVAENYGPIFTKRNLEERRRNLAGRYWFFCECNACRENWPCLEIMTNDDVRLRCPTKGCSNIHQRPRNSSKSIFECSCCRRKIDLRKPLDHVRECEQLYTRGFEAMEKEQPEKALEAFFEATSKFHKIAMPPHKDTHLAEIAASACMADEGNVYRFDSFL